MRWRSASELGQKYATQKYPSQGTQICKLHGPSIKPRTRMEHLTKSTKTQNRNVLEERSCALTKVSFAEKLAPNQLHPCSPWWARETEHPKQRLGTNYVQKDVQHRLALLCGVAVIPWPCCEDLWLWFTDVLLADCFSELALPASVRGTNKLNKWCNISWAYSFGSSITGLGTQARGTVSAENHSQYTFTQSRIVSCWANGRLRPKQRTWKLQRRIRQEHKPAQTLGSRCDYLKFLFHKITTVKSRV